MRPTAAVALLAAYLCSPRLCSAASAEEVSYVKQQFGSLPACQAADWSAFLDNADDACANWESEALFGGGEPCPAKCFVAYKALGKQCMAEVAVEGSDLWAFGTDEANLTQWSAALYDACASGTAVAGSDVVDEVDALREQYSSIPSCANADYEGLAASNCTYTEYIAFLTGGEGCPSNPQCTLLLRDQGRACFADLFTAAAGNQGDIAAIGISTSDFKRELGKVWDRCADSGGVSAATFASSPQALLTAAAAAAGAAVLLL